MQVIQSDSNGINVIPMESLFLSKRKIWFTGQINTDSALHFAKQLMFLVEESKSDPINIYINSSGGTINAGFIILDCLKACPCEVNIIGLEMVGSMAAIIMACGATRGHRYLLPHSKMMIHEPLISDGFGGSATAIQQTAKGIMRMKSTIVDLLADATGKSKNDVKKSISFDNYLSADEAVDFGLADGVINSLF